MTSCPPAEMLTRYREGTLGTADEMSDLEIHLADCAACRQALRQAVRHAESALVSALSPIPAGSACLNEDLIDRYAAGNADAADRELAEAHAADCRFCAEEIKAARAYHTQMQGYDWASAYAIADGYTWQGRVRAWFARKPRRRWLVAAPAALACALLALLMVRVAQSPYRQQIASLQGQMHRLQQSQNELAHQLQFSREQEARAVAQVPAMQARVSQLEQEAARLRQRNELLRQKASISPVIPAPQRSMALNDGTGKLVIDPKDGPVRVQKLPPAVIMALQNQKLETPLALVSLRGRNSTLLGKGEDTPFTLYSPLSTFVLSRRPTFRWQSQADATGYVVTVVDVANDREIESGTLSPNRAGGQMEWTLPATNDSLRRGGLYRWYVVATLRDGRIVQSPSRSGAPAKFQVLDAAAAKAIQQAQETYAGSPLTLGILYARAGLLDDARRELHTVVTANPESTVTRQLIQSLSAHSK